MVVKASDICSKLLHDAIAKFGGPVLASISLNWDIIACGLSSKTYPLKIVFYRARNKKIQQLIVCVNNSSTSLEVIYAKSALIDRVNFTLGYQAINDIKVELAVTW